jgi:hypothetical protein
VAWITVSRPGPHLISCHEANGRFVEQQEMDMNSVNTNSEVNLLSDDELDAVAGGVAMKTTNPIFLANGRGGNQVSPAGDFLESAFFFGVLGIIVAAAA